MIHPHKDLLKYNVCYTLLLMTETGSNYFLTFLDTFLMTLSDLANGIWLSWRGPDPVAWLYLRTSNDDYENL